MIPTHSVFKEVISLKGGNADPLPFKSVILLKDIRQVEPQLHTLVRKKKIYKTMELLTDQSGLSGLIY